MPRNKNETLTLRTTNEVKELLRLAAEKDHRSMASMIEVLIRDHARRTKLRPAGSPQEQATQ